jgi:hypothetical protein
MMAGLPEGTAAAGDVAVGTAALQLCWSRDLSYDSVAKRARIPVASPD